MVKDDRPSMRNIAFAFVMSSFLIWLSIRRPTPIVNRSITIQACSSPSGQGLIGAYGGDYFRESATLVPHVRHNYDVSEDDFVGSYAQIFQWAVDSENETVRLLVLQGLFQLYGFNKHEARRNFQESTLVDADCVVCLWGLASSYGPNLNERMTLDDAAAGASLICKAEQIFDRLKMIGNNSSNVHWQLLFGRDAIGRYIPRLIAAARVRFGNCNCSTSGICTKASLSSSFDEEISNAHYRDALEALMVDFPSQLDIAALFVEASLQFTTWDYFQPDSYEVYPRSSRGHAATLFATSPSLKTSLVEPVRVLMHILQQSAYHPLALHLYIHITEQSDTPKLGLPAADRLLYISSHLGSNHLIHMPGHTYMRCGQYEMVIESGRRAIESHKQYSDNCLTPYVASHDIALVVMAALSSGRRRLAIEHAVASALGARSAVVGDEATIRPTVNSFAARYVTGLFPTFRDLVMCRFGSWNEIISMHMLSALPPRNLQALRKAHSNRELLANDFQPYFLVVHWYAQVLALIHSPMTARDLITSRMVLLSDAVATTQATQPIFLPSHVFYGYHHEMAAIMNHTATAAFSLREHKLSKLPEMRSTVLDSLGKALQLQDNFSYMEPENFYLPIRQCLAASLNYFANYSIRLASNNSCDSADIAMSDSVSATTLLVEDLSPGFHPNNGWSLRELLTSLRLIQKILRTVSACKTKKFNLIEIRKDLNHLLKQVQSVTVINVTTEDIGVQLDATIASVKTSYRHSWRYADAKINGGCCELGLC